MRKLLCASCGPTSKHIITCCSTRNLRLWRAHSQRCLLQRPVNQLLVSPSHLMLPKKHTQSQVCQSSYFIEVGVPPEEQCMHACMHVPTNIDSASTLSEWGIDVWSFDFACVEVICWSSSFWMIPNLLGCSWLSLVWQLMENKKKKKKRERKKKRGRFSFGFLEGEATCVLETPVSKQGLVSALRMIFSVMRYFMSLWKLRGWHHLWMSEHLLSWKMDEFIRWPTPYLLLVATCDEILSWMIEIWREKSFGEWQ